MGGRGPPPAAGGRRGGARPTDAVVRYTKRLNREYAERGDVDGAKQLIEAMLSEGVAPTLVSRKGRGWELWGGFGGASERLLRGFWEILAG